jgi:hypothetical protein
MGRSKAMKFEIGDKVRVVAPDPHGGGNGYIGKTGRIVNTSTTTDYDWDVYVDGLSTKGTDLYPFMAVELERIDEPATPTPVNDNPTIRSIILEAVDAQFAKGAKKYAQGVDVGDGHDWVVEAAQEVADTFVYLASEIARLRRRVNELEHRG